MAEPAPETTPSERGMTLEKIKGETGFTALCEYPDFSRDRFISPSALDDLGCLSEEHGEHNVLLSMFERDGEIHLGVFIRK